jgi:hypothetical protein
MITPHRAADHPLFGLQTTLPPRMTKPTRVVAEMSSSGFPTRRRRQRTLRVQHADAIDPE